jgi:hypothetical protein
MHLDAGNIDACQSIPQRDTGMSESGRVNDNKLSPIIARLMNRFDQFLLTVALQTRQADARALSVCLQSMINVI